MGYVYCIQPAELVGTRRYKIGMSSLSNLNRIRSYKVGTRYLCMLEQKDALATERKIKKAFNTRYSIIAGNEYFEVNDDEQTMIQLFINTVMGQTPKVPRVLEAIQSPQTWKPRSTWRARRTSIVAKLAEVKMDETDMESDIDLDDGLPATEWLKKFAFDQSTPRQSCT